MNRLLALLLCLFLLTAPACAEEVSLTGTWYCGDGDPALCHTIKFRADGTGEMISHSMTLPMTGWRLDDDTLIMEYVFLGKNRDTGDIYTLVLENDEVVIRFNNGEKVRTFHFQPEGVTGTWTCALADAQATLILGEDGSGSLTIGTTKYVLTWGKVQNVITLVQNNIPLTAIHADNSITLTLGGNQLVFTR